VNVHRTIRVGPPRAKPNTTLSTADLSGGGLFVDADRPARLGARISAELVLSGGLKVYVPEAQVAHNRMRTTGSGFGVRFLDVPPDVQALIDREIDEFKDDSMPPLPIPVRNDSDPEQPTLVLEKRCEPGAWTEDLIQLVRKEPDVHDTIPMRKVDRRREGPPAALWLFLVGLGSAALVMAAGLFLSATLQPSLTVEPLEDEPRVLSSPTHQVLMGEADPSLLDPEPALPSEPDLEPLPLPEVASQAAPQPAPAPESSAVLAPPASEPGGAPPSSPWRVAIDLPEGRAVKSAYVLREPDRFVVDVVGLQRPPKLEGLGVRVRFGRHDGFGRLVLDLDRRVRSGRAELVEGRLQIELQP
jgi:hypothetical protein